MTNGFKKMFCAWLKSSPRLTHFWHFSWDVKKSFFCMIYAFIWSNIFLAQNLVCVKELPFLTAQNSGAGLAQCVGWGAVRYINTQTHKQTNVATYRQDWPRGQLSGNLKRYIKLFQLFEFRLRYYSYLWFWFFQRAFQCRVIYLSSFNP